MLLRIGWTKAYASEASPPAWSWVWIIDRRDIEGQVWRLGSVVSADASSGTALTEIVDMPYRSSPLHEPALVLVGRFFVKSGTGTIRRVCAGEVSQLMGGGG